MCRKDIKLKATHWTRIHSRTLVTQLFLIAYGRVDIWEVHQMICASVTVDNVEFCTLECFWFTIYYMRIEKKYFYITRTTTFIIIYLTCSQEMFPPTNKQNSSSQFVVDMHSGWYQWVHQVVFFHMMTSSSSFTTEMQRNVDQNTQWPYRSQRVYINVSAL